MNTRVVLVSLALLVGLFSGPSSLESAGLSQPPVQWSDLAFIFFGSTIALPVVLGFQALVGNNKALRLGWSIFSLIAIFLVATGISAGATALLQGTLFPHSFLFLVLGLGTLLGAVLTRTIFSQRFANAV
ncbi:hypothetical protein EIP75_23915 [Aquabacterium soli]|uniref:Uncharacterized protein n=1 Tax=Aquabacterium soli TaxID=2493092 RepID=A0A3R8S4S1_9BURK|nr:hypothetical protein [Aquabacterium soli]RRR98824.1 hypothetical protein EIP75_23915 [Aquabacterium soli]